jgi:hypothetical protein
MGASISNPSEPWAAAALRDEERSLMNGSTTHLTAANRLRTLENPPRWVMFLNGDEFLAFRDGLYDDVNDFFLDNVSSWALQISWLVFGTAIKPLIVMSR